MKHSKTITIAIIDCVDPPKAATVLAYCTKLWETHKSVLFTHENGISFYNISIIKIDKIDSIKKYNEFILQELYKYIDTDYCLIVQTDGFILNPKKWNPTFLQYDFIGAPMPDYAVWISLQQDIYKQAIVQCDENRWPLNGGFSLRSKRLLELSSKCPYPIEALAEDMYITLYFRQWFEQQGMLFADRTFAYSFAKENPIKDHEFNFNDCFGFHGKFSPKQQELLKIPENHRSGINTILKQYLSINSSVSLARYCKLWFRNKRKGLRNYDDIYEFYIESIKETKKPKKLQGQIDVIILQKTTDLNLLENIVRNARKNIQHTIKNCFIISDNYEAIEDFCSNNNCTAVDNKKLNDLQRFSSLGNSDNFCILQDNTIIIKPLSLFSKQSITVFFDIEKENTISSPLAQLFKINNQLPIDFNTSVLCFNKKHVASFFAKHESFFLNNKIDFEASILLFYQLALQNKRRLYKLMYPFPHQRKWIGEADFFIDLYKASLTKWIGFNNIDESAYFSPSYQVAKVRSEY